ncbi:unnamed protein product, partial [Didymodactylos carnosus]
LGIDAPPSSSLITLNEFYEFNKHKQESTTSMMPVNIPSSSTTDEAAHKEIEDALRELTTVGTVDAISNTSSKLLMQKPIPM